jgi:type 1 glutamine amidotransferase
MRRREMLAGCGAAVLGLSTFPLGWVAAAEKKRQKVLYFTRSAGFEHSAVQRKGNELSVSEKALTEMGKKAGFDVECTKDGRVFDGDLDQYDLIAFYTTGDLTRPNKQQTPPMTAAGKRKLLRAIAAGKGFVGFHSATDTFHSQGGRNAIQTKVDPYIAMLGGEFVSHGAQQEAAVLITSPKFPGVRDLAPAKQITLMEEWYALKNFPKDLHVILVQETEGMKGDCYQRPPFPCTWAHLHGKGHVFYTSFGHRHEIWANPQVQAIMLGGIAWAMGNVEADIRPNIDQVAPKANQLHN